MKKHDDEIERTIHAPKPTTHPHGGVHMEDDPVDDGGGPETKPDPKKP